MSDEYRSWTAAYVLGALDADDRARFESHLRGCGDCRAEVAELAPMPGLLARTSPPSASPAVDGGIGLALAEVGSERRHLQRTRRRWRNAALGAMATVLVLVVVLVTGGGAVPREPSGDRVELAVASTTATAEVGLRTRPWGSVVDIHLVELSERPDAESFTAWVVDRAGRWEPACTWGVDGDGWARVEGASSIRVEEVSEVVVTAADDRSSTLLRALPRS